MALLAAFSAAAAPPIPQTPWPSSLAAEPVRASCKQVDSCEAAVALWCNGYSRADADHDGIPCENVCHSRAQVEAIEAQIGCSN